MLILIVLAGLFRAWWPGRIEKVFQEFAGTWTALCFIAAGLTLVSRIGVAIEREEVSQEAQERRSAVGGTQPQQRPKGKEMAYENWGN